MCLWCARIEALDATNTGGEVRSISMLVGQKTTFPEVSVSRAVPVLIDCPAGSVIAVPG